MENNNVLKLVIHDEKLEVCQELKLEIENFDHSKFSKGTPSIGEKSNYVLVKHKPICNHIYFGHHDDECEKCKDLSSYLCYECGEEHGY